MVFIYMMFDYVEERGVGVWFVIEGLNMIVWGIDVYIGI